MTHPKLCRRRLTSRLAGHHLVKTSAMIVALLSLTACGENNPAQGSSGASTAPTTAGAEQTGASNAAPDAQPHYNQVGSGVASRVVTNAAGQPLGDAKGGAREDDQALSERVRVALSTGTTGTTGIYAPDTLLDISVTATNGIVTLRGTVGSQSTRQAMEERARSLQGVRGVKNELEVSATKRGLQPGAPAGRGQVDVVPQQTGSAPQ